MSLRVFLSSPFLFFSSIPPLGGLASFSCTNARFDAQRVTERDVRHENIKTPEIDFSGMRDLFVMRGVKFVLMVFG